MRHCRLPKQSAVPNGPGCQRARVQALPVRHGSVYDSRPRFLLLGPDTAPWHHNRGSNTPPCIRHPLVALTSCISPDSVDCNLLSCSTLFIHLHTFGVFLFSAAIIDSTEVWVVKKLLWYRENLSEQFADYEF